MASASASNIWPRLIITGIWYFFDNYFCLGLGLNLQKLASASASASASRFWPRLTSLHNTASLITESRACRPFDLFVKFLPRDALQCKARSCDRMSSVRLSVTLVDCDHIGWNSAKISRLVSVGRSLSAECISQHQGPTPREQPEIWAQSDPPLLVRALKTLDRNLCAFASEMYLTICVEWAEDHWFCVT